MADIRTPQEEDRARIVELMRISFNAPAAWIRHIAPTLRLDRFLAAYEEGRVVAMADAWDLRQWFGGRALPMAGVAAVAAFPERRDAGLAPDVVRALLVRSKQTGALLSTLYPSRASVYRRLGYEYAGVLTQYRVPIADLPASRRSTVREFQDSDLDAVRACYGTIAAQHTGLADTDDESWWRVRIFRRWNPDVVGRGVVVPSADGTGIDGYAAFQIESLPDTWGFRITCTHLMGGTAAGLAGLLGYFRSFRGLGQSLVWYGASNDPLSLLAGGGAETIQAVRSVRFMTRLLDVPGSLRSRGYPPVTGRAVIGLRDEIFPENEGPFLLEAEQGRVRVERVNETPGTVFPIGAFSSMFAGYLSPYDLSRAGLIGRDDPSLRFLGSLFTGPTPWMTDFF